MMATIEHRPEALLKIFIRYAGDPPPVDNVEVKSDQSEWTQADKDLCKKIEKSKNGEQLAKLFTGKIDAYGSQSEADLAFCNILAFWCAKDSEQMDRIFRKSGLYRRKWDERHGEFTYGQMTLQKAIAGTKKVYQGKASTSSTEKKPNHFKLLTDNELAALPPIQWKIKGVLPDKGLGVLFGPPGGAKSFMGIDMAQAVASGADWFGHRTKPCRVIYCALEGEGGIAGRVKAYKIKHGQSSDNIRYLIQPFNLLVSDDIQGLAKAIQAIGGAGLVVLDTLNRAAPGADENSSKDMGLIITASKELQALIGGFVLLVSHTGKDASKGIRGHSSLHAALDAAIEVKRTGDKREWTIPKVKDGEDGASFPFSLQVIEMGVDEDGDKITSCVIEQTTSTKREAPTKPLTDIHLQGLESYRQAAVVDGLLDKEGNFAGLHLEAWRPKFYSISTAANKETKSTYFRRAKKQLVELGQLSVEDDIYRLQGPDSELFEADFAIKLKANRTPDTSQTTPGQVRQCD